MHAVCGLKEEGCVVYRKKEGGAQLDNDKPFMYGHILRLEYEYSNSLNLIVMFSETSSTNVYDAYWEIRSSIVVITKLATSGHKGETTI